MYVGVLLIFFSKNNIGFFEILLASFEFYRCDFLDFSSFICG